MAEPIYVLGDVTFSLTEVPVSSLKRARNWNWQSQEVVGAAPRKSFLGPGEETITLEGVVFPGELGSRAALASLSSMADKGEPQPLVDGDGFVYGMWVIKSISEAHETLIAGGKARAISWSLTLEWYDG